MSMTVILPRETTGQIEMSGQSGGAAPPVLYLLHVLSDDKLDLAAGAGLAPLRRA